MRLNKLVKYLFENEEYSVSTRKHMRKNPLGDFEDVPVGEQNEGLFKPKGFWYDCDNEWSNWVELEMPDWKGDYVYSVKLDHSKMKVIRNLEELKAFNAEYGSEEHFGMINWRRVAEDYFGIEICPYIWEARHEYDWYYTWDVASGCIWKRDAIMTIEEEPKAGV
jgi:hypothetical protein